jgi:pimeloyl-ACP methyl ester carboxylesterase
MLPRPGTLASVTILNTAAFADTVIPWRIRFCRVPVIGELAVRGFNGFAWPATWMAVTKPLPAPVKAGFLFPYDSWANRIATHRFVRDIPRGIGAPNDLALAKIESALPSLAAHRVQLVWGAHDFCFNRHYFERWQGMLPKAESVYLESAGHYLIEDEQAAVVERIRQLVLA